MHKTICKFITLTIIWQFHIMFMYFQDAPIAQPDRVPDFESVGRGFEPLWAHHYLFFRSWIRTRKGDPQVSLKRFIWLSLSHLPSYKPAILLFPGIFFSISFTYMLIFVLVIILGFRVVKQEQYHSKNNQRNSREQQHIWGNQQQSQ